MTNETNLRIISRRLRRMEEIRAAALEVFEGADDPALCVRRIEVVEYVARRLGLIVSGYLCREITEVMRAAGWEPVHVRSRSLYRRCKRRNLSKTAALLQSRELRQRICR